MANAKKRPPGLVVTVSRCKCGRGYCGTSELSVPNSSLFVCTSWLRKAGCEPTDTPSRWRVRFERVK